MSALETGILIGFGACAWCVASLLQARWSRSIPASRSIRIGFNLFIAGALLLITTNFMPGPTSAENVGILPHQTTTVLLYIAMGVCAFGTGMAFNTCVSNAMANTQSGQEGATSTSLGIISSLSVGLISGVGGAVLNSGERHGISFGYTVGAIWSITVLCAILALIMIRRLQRFEKLSVPNDLTRQTP